MSKSDRLLTPQQTAFVFAILQGATQVEAYKAAGYKGGAQADAVSADLIRHRANGVARAPRVAHALAAARAQQAERAQITVQDLVDKLERAYDVALTCDPPQANAAVSATMGIGKLLGLVLDRSELTVIRDKPSPVASKVLELSEDEWRKTFAKKRVTGHNER